MRISVRQYRATDAEAIAEIFYQTVHRINGRDYTREQIEAWAPLGERDDERWADRLAKTRPFVAEVAGRVAGFCELERDGRINCFYCHHEHQRQGVGSRLMQEILAVARDRGLCRLYAEVSLTARSFFRSFGFETVDEQRVMRRGVGIPNTLMEL